MAIAGKAVECGRRWQERIGRAAELAEREPRMAEVLQFYIAVLRFQMNAACAVAVEAYRDMPFRAQMHIPTMTAWLPELLAITVEGGPGLLRSEAASLIQAGKESWDVLFNRALSDDFADLTPTDEFFVRACFQPFAETLQVQIPAVQNYSLGVCPVCGSRPQAAILRPEGEGAKRWLLCSLCMREWVYRRVVCPWCGEEDREKLPRYSSEEWAHVRVEGCDTCKRYLKSIDLSIDGRAVPLVDEVAIAGLDAWAQAHGYKKIRVNLIGL